MYTYICAYTYVSLNPFFVNTTIQNIESGIQSLSMHFIYNFVGCLFCLYVIILIKVSLIWTDHSANKYKIHGGKKRFKNSTGS
jgi:hypothetical protein